MPSKSELIPMEPPFVFHPNTFVQVNTWAGLLVGVVEDVDEEWLEISQAGSGDIARIEIAAVDEAWYAPMGHRV